MTKLKNRRQILFYGGAMWFGVIFLLSCMSDLNEVQDSTRALWYAAAIFVVPFALIATVGFIKAWKQLPWREK